MATQAYLQQLRLNKHDFLTQVQAGSDLSEWVVSVGNEAGDLDSLACALADAHFAREKDAAAKNRRRHIPLFLSRRTDLHLRPENLLALETAQIPAQDLLTIDDLPAARLSNLGTRFSLVDHNVLLDQFRSHPESPDDSPDDDARVVSILDHHVDERKHLGAEPRVIELIGSCSSLVTRQYVGAGEPVPTPLADLLLSAIAIDTRMKPVTDGGKAADVDLNAVETLVPFSSFFATSATAAVASSSSGSPPTGAAAVDALKAYNSRLSDAKEDVAHLSGHDLLRRDYKEYHESSIRYGLSTVPLSLSTWLERFSHASSSSSSSPDANQEALNELLDEVRLWMDERDLALAGVLTSYSHIKKSGTVGGRRREILIVARGSNDQQAAAFDSVFAGLEKDQVLELGEWKAIRDYSIDRGRGERKKGGERGWERWQVWQQENARATRKQVAPALKDLVHQAFGGSPERL
ncbi:Exopolyphosphatase [Rhodotorula mucilaginosa]|uniref:Exopolyphosphatase n=1 Tax=Rhodotorula mucilaginosa TaxID=5537 RepID=A0A9P7B6Q1_RHOMI|nr:Exopolyphosphatase [Rhodotorula mucilaginosa]